jgi:hypothetical protein
MVLLKVTDPLIGKVTGGAIMGLDGVWCTTPGFYDNPSEFVPIAYTFNPESNDEQTPFATCFATDLRDQELVTQRSRNSKTSGAKINPHHPACRYR